MNFKKLVILFALVDFTILSILAMWHEGIQGMIQLAKGSLMGATLTADLCISLTLVATALYRDARQHGRSPWPFLVLTLTTGSIGPLLYLLLRSDEEATVPELADVRT
jgi:hypothetical protein